MEHRRFGKVVTKMLLPLKGLFEHRVGVVSTKNFHWTNNSSSNGMAYVFDVGNDIQLHPAIRKRDTWLLNCKGNLKPWPLGHLQLPLGRLGSFGGFAGRSNLLPPLVARNNGICNVCKQAT